MTNRNVTWKCMHLMKTTIRLLLLLLIMFCENADSGAIMGPAKVVIKFTETCKWTSPKLINYAVRIYQRRGKLLISANLTFPFKFSDELEYDTNVAVKRNGGWIQNFFKFKGKGICSGIMSNEKDLFNVLAEGLKAPKPYRCPLPPGTAHIVDFEGTDPTSALKKFGLEVMPYGEFRVSANISHNREVAICLITYVDLVPKKGKSG